MFISAAYLEPDLAAASVIAALYLPGAPRPHDPPRAHWRSVVGALRRAGKPLGHSSHVLRAAGLWSEALVLETPGLLARAECQVNEEKVLTVVSTGYPSRWLNLTSQPPALHCSGEIPKGPFLGVVGSRHVPLEVCKFASLVGLRAEELGFTVVSGGAIGCDQAAVSLCGHFIELLPCGPLMSSGQKRGCRLSARPPGEPFTVAAAMERNALIYAATAHTVVVHARFKEGGTWTGVTEAIRRRLTSVIVREDDTSRAHRSLIGLGGSPLPNPEGLETALAAVSPQSALGF